MALKTPIGFRTSKTSPRLNNSSFSPIEKAKSSTINTFIIEKAKILDFSNTGRKRDAQINSITFNFGTSYWNRNMVRAFGQIMAISSRVLRDEIAWCAIPMNGPVNPSLATGTKPMSQTEFTVSNPTRINRFIICFLPRVCNVQTDTDIPLRLLYSCHMAPRVNWDKLVPAFDFKAWSDVDGRSALAQKHFPMLTAYYEDKLGRYVPADVVQELVAFKFNGTDTLIAGKMVALQTHIKISDSANCLRLATELLMLSTNKESTSVFVAQFVRALLTK